jgi:ABC-type lipoprotein release transport system permease subunit
MAIPWSYSLLNLKTRKLTTFLTAAGMAMVVFVFASIQMLAAGLEETLRATGSPENAVIIRKSSATEVQSSVDRLQASIVETQPEVAVGADGESLAAREVMVLISLTQRGGDRPANVAIRGIEPHSIALRPGLRLSAGRLPKPGSSEIIAGKSITRRFSGVGIGENLRFALRDWTVVGVFDAGSTGFDSEIWADRDQLMQAFRRPFSYSSVLVRLADPSRFDDFKKRIEGDPRLSLEVKRETRFWSDQSEAMSTLLSYLGTSLSVVFSIGAIIGAMITMYSAVANRVSEIGTLRALGFQRGSILTAFLLESAFLGLIGGLVGVASASLLQVLSVSTTNWQTFSELAFSFHLTAGIIGKSMVFGVGMGLLGGMLPAARAARLGIVDALRG